MGVGHFVRTLALAKGILKHSKNADITIVSGGKPVDFIIPKGISVKYLPEISISDNSNDLKTNTKEDISNLIIKRRDILLKLYKGCSPDFLFIEFFPFGRFELAEEIIPLLKLAKKDQKGASKKPVIISSVRDMVVSYKENLSETEIKEYLDNYFDYIFVHGDKRVYSLENEFPFLKNMYSKLRYTGYTVFERGETEKSENFPLPKETKKILISAGGGMDSFEFIKSCISAKSILDKSINSEFLISTGPFISKSNWDTLKSRVKKEKGIKLDKFNNSFYLDLKNSDLSISNAGYNTVVEVLNQGKSAIFIPRVRGGIGDKEQLTRAEVVSDNLHVITLNTKCASPEEIAKSARSIFNNKEPYKKTNINLSGTDYVGKFVVGYENNKDNKEKGRKKRKVGILRSLFLDKSDHFIFEEINSLKNYEPIVFSVEEINKSKIGNIVVVSDEKFSTLLTKDYPLLKKSLIPIYNKFIEYIKEQVVSNGISLLHAEFGDDALFFLPVKRLTGLPLVVSFRGQDIYKMKEERKGLYKPLFDETEVFLVRCNSMKMDLANMGCPENKIVVHHSSIDIKKIDKIVEDSNLEKSKEIKKILFSGRFIEKKGPIDALKIFAELKKNKKELSLIMVGDGPLKKEVVSFINKNNLKDVTLKPFLDYDNFISEIVSSDMFLLPCKEASDGNKEGIPVVLMEAMAAGVPVVSSFHSGISDLIKDGESGMLAREGDINGFVKKISSLIEDTSLRQRLSEEAKKSVNFGFNLQFQIIFLESIYSGILDFKGDITSRWNIKEGIRAVLKVVDIFKSNKSPVRLIEFMAFYGVKNFTFDNSGLEKLTLKEREELTKMLTSSDIFPLRDTYNIYIDDEELRNLSIILNAHFVGPKELHVEMTNFCTSNCIYCWWYSPLKNTPMGKAWKDLKMDANVFKQLIDDASSIGTERVVFSGHGEPFLHPDIIEMIEYVKKKNMVAIILTSGLKRNFCLDEATQDKIMDMGLDWLFINLSAASKETYKIIRAGVKEDTFNSMINMIKRFKEVSKDSRPHIKLIFVIIRTNVLEVFNYMKLGADLGLESVEYKIMETSPGTEDLLISEKELPIAISQLKEAKSLAEKLGIWTNCDEILEIFQNVNGKNGKIDYDSYQGGDSSVPRCYDAWLSSRVTTEGYVTFCCDIEDRFFGNIHNIRFKDLWLSKDFRKERIRWKYAKDLFDKPLPSCNMCIHRETNQKVYDSLCNLGLESKIMKNKAGK